MYLKLKNMFVTFIFHLVHCVYSDHILSCNRDHIPPCLGKNQVCNETSNDCECMDGFVRVGTDCNLVPGSKPNAGATAAAITVLTLALVFGGLALVIKKYNLIEYVRRKLRRSNDIVYEDVMIGHDDPPLSP